MLGNILSESVRMIFVKDNFGENVTRYITIILIIINFTVTVCVGEQLDDASKFDNGSMVFLHHDINNSGKILKRNADNAVVVMEGDESFNNHNHSIKNDMIMNNTSDKILNVINGTIRQATGMTMKTSDNFDGKQNETDSNKNIIIAEKDNSKSIDEISNQDSTSIEVGSGSSGKHINGISIRKDNGIHSDGENGISNSSGDVRVNTPQNTLHPENGLLSLIYLTTVKYKLEGEMDKSSPLYGRINEDILVAVYTNDFNDSYTAHLGTLYTTTFLQNNSTKRLSSNKYKAEIILKGLDYIYWPFNRTDPEERKIFVKNQIMDRGFIEDNSSYSKNQIKEFVKGFDLDDSLMNKSCSGCFCSVYKNKTQELSSKEQSIICFSTEFTQKQLTHLYPKPKLNQDGITVDENNKRVGCREELDYITYKVSSDGLLRPRGNLTSELDLKRTGFKKKEEKINITSPLFGRINDKNISIGLFTNETGFDCKMHLGTLYATSFLRDNSTYKLSGKNEQAMNIFSGLKNISWPFNSDDPGIRKRFVEKRIEQMDYIEDKSNYSKYYINEFINGFYLDNMLDPKACRQTCFCKIYHHKQSRETESYEETLICFTPVLTTKQIKILYSEHLAEEAYTKYSSIALIVSSVFIFVTLIVYIWLPELRKIVYGQCICLYLVSMFVSYTIMYVITIKAEYLGDFCRPLGYIAQFSWLTNFTWQTILCLDILMAFRKVKPLVNSSKMESRKKLALYCSYAYGLPALITLITALLQFTPILDDKNPWKPNMNKYCFFPKMGEKNVRWLYFSGPYGAMILMNCLMFIVTVILIARHSRATSKTFNRGSFRKSNTAKQDKDMIRAHITLFFVMGTNWIFELIIMIHMNTIPPNSLFWQMFDTVNNLIGVVLFFVLIFKPQVFKIVREQYEIYFKKLKMQITDDHLHSSGSAATQMSNLSNNNCISKEDSSPKL